ncbi:aldehyde dehydrogenase [Metaclostridioides mangenotii]|uniref:aldehyde dehydrogenase n=1 Tax=Metaclostridioides mangenotii TaxID=1540 RepID=UPI0004674FE4|nr:aldehyde dehydrogenase [Clostridioides mangenotii]
MDRVNYIDNILDNQRKYYSSGITRKEKFILRQLNTLKKAIIEYEDIILEALKKDLNKSKFEAYETEVGIIISEINYAIKNVKRWRRPVKVKTPIINFGSRGYIYNQPYGNCLIISPWNYPFQLTLSPLIGSIAAGNCSIVKPSEMSQNTSEVLKVILEKSFERGYIDVVEGGIDVNEYLLNSEFDYIFFTGSPSIGKKVARKASDNLTPFTLELGGKSPCIVDKSADIKLSAKKIVWGKLINAGQTCIAPDYILVNNEVKQNLIEEMIFYIEKFYTKNTLICDDYVSIINEKHFSRLIGLVDKTKVVYGGNYKEDVLKIEPTILDNVILNDEIMQEEIFGPLIPIIEYGNFNDIENIVSANKNPLALYVFSKDKEFVNKVIETISFGGGCVNDTIMHITNYNLPFGGIGRSGIGSYHGKKSFDSFSHKKSIMKSSSMMDIKYKYPPYTEKAYSLIKKVFNTL